MRTALKYLRRSAGEAFRLGCALRATRGTYVLRAVLCWDLLVYEKKVALRPDGHLDLVIFGVAGAGYLAPAPGAPTAPSAGTARHASAPMGLAGTSRGQLTAPRRGAPSPEGSKSGLSRLPITAAVPAGGHGGFGGGSRRPAGVCKCHLRMPTYLAGSSAGIVGLPGQRLAAVRH